MPDDISRPSKRNISTPLSLFDDRLNSTWCMSHGQIDESAQRMTSPGYQRTIHVGHTETSVHGRYATTTVPLANLLDAIPSMTAPATQPPGASQGLRLQYPGVAHIFGNFALSLRAATCRFGFDDLRGRIPGHAVLPGRYGTVRHVPMR